MNQKLTEKTPTHLLLAHSDAEREVLQSRLPKRGPRVSMVDWVDGQKCVRIPLTQGKDVLVDYDDFKLVGHLRWYAQHINRVWYAARRQYPGKTFQFMHRLLLGFPSTAVDHRNENGLDNRRCNIRVADKAKNSWNRGLQKNNTTGYRGVIFRKDTKLWSARIKVNGKVRYLGNYGTREEAAAAYDAAAKKIAPEFARLNFK